jgi:hypothetical protein
VSSIGNKTDINPEPPILAQGTGAPLRVVIEVGPDVKVGDITQRSLRRQEQRV